MPTNVRYKNKGRRGPRHGLIQQARVSIGLAHKYAAPLAKAGWPAEKTTALEAGVSALESNVSTQYEERGEARGSTRSEHQAVTSAKAFLRRLGNALVMVLRDSPVPGVSAESFEVGGKLARSTPKISAHLTKIRASLALLDTPLQTYFAGEKASVLLDKVKGALDAADTQQEVAVTGLPVETGKVCEAKGQVLELIEDLNRVAKIAFDGDAAMVGQFNKDVLARARKPRKKTGATETGSASASATSPTTAPVKVAEPALSTAAAIEPATATEPVTAIEPVTATVQVTAIESATATA